MKKIKFIKNHPSGLKEGAEKELANDHADRLEKEGYVQFLDEDQFPGLFNIDDKIPEAPEKVEGADVDAPKKIEGADVNAPEKTKEEGADAPEKVEGEGAESVDELKNNSKPSKSKNK